MGSFLPFTISSLLFATASIIHLTSAADCRGDFIVSSQQDADTQMVGCHTIIGSIIIGGNYSGPLVISNITNITEGIIAQSIYEPTGLLLGPQNLTSLQADSVVTMEGGDVWLVDVPLLTSVSMSNLQSADSINIAFNSTGTLNFPALVNSSDIHVFGNIISMNFANLTTVSDQLYIGSIIPAPDPNIPDIYTSFSYTSDIYAAYQGIDIAFPALKNATAVDLWGNISSLSMPELGIIALPPNSSTGGGMFSTGLVIQTFGNPLNITLPKLSQADGVNIEGTIGSISLPSLYSVSGDYSVACMLPMAVDLHPLTSVNNLNITGSITNLTLTSIQSIHSQELLQSNYGLDCVSLAPSWLNEITPTIENFAYEAIGPWTYICYPGIKFHRHKLYPLSTGGMVGIGLGIGIPLVLFIIWFVHRRGNKKIAREVEKTRQARLYGIGSGDGHELEERAHHDAPPVYEPSREEDCVQSNGAESGVGVRGGQRPPGYHDTLTSSGRTEGGEVRAAGEAEIPREEE